MRVMGDIQHQCGLARHDLKAARQFHESQAVAHCLRRHRQALAQAAQRRQHARRVDQLVRAAQRRIGQAAVTPPATLLAG